MDQIGSSWSEKVNGLPHEVPATALVLSGLVLTVTATASVVWPESIRGYPSLAWVLAVIPAFLLAYYKRWHGSAISLGMATMLVVVLEAGSSLATTSAIRWWLSGIVVVVLIAVSLGAGFVSDAHRRHALDAFKLANADPQTGLPNRRVIEILLEKEFAAGRWGRPCSVVMIEIDGLQQHTDRQHPQADDLTLFVVGVVLKCFARSGDLACSYGREKFIVLLPGAGKRRAITFAKRVTWDVASQFRDGHTRITVSSGVASQDRSMTHYSQLVELADSALHAAKRRGGNRVAAGYPGAEEVWLPPRPPIETPSSLRSA
jgi:diguanylate cyclase (GGDEF)-like protein